MRGTRDFLSSPSIFFLLRARRQRESNAQTIIIKIFSYFNFVCCGHEQPTEMYGRKLSNRVNRIGRWKRQEEKIENIFDGRMWMENNDSIKSFRSHDTHIVNVFDWITRVRRINSSFLCACTRAFRLCGHSTARRLPYSHQTAVDFRSTSANAVHIAQLHTYTRSTSILHDISPTQVICLVVKKERALRIARDI